MVRRSFLNVAGASVFAVPAIIHGETETMATAQPESKPVIKRINSIRSRPASEKHFTHKAFVEDLFTPIDPAKMVIVNVTFEPGARTYWHSHPRGQVLIVTAGRGRTQCWGGPLKEIQPGDVIWFAKDEKHWHVPAPDSLMTHIAIQEQRDDMEQRPADADPDWPYVKWMEEVTDQQYDPKKPA